MNYNRWVSGSNCYNMYSVWTPNTSLELYHHGVKGMKWGVRRERNSFIRRTKRDMHMLNDYQRAKGLRNLKDKYDTGKIDKEHYKASKKQLKIDYKQKAKDIKHLKTDKSLSEVKKKFTETRSRAMSEIPNYRLKRGVRTVNTLLNAIAAGSLIASSGMLGVGAAMMGASYGAAAGVAYGAGAAVGVGAAAGVKVVDAKIRRKIIQATS